MEVSDRTHKLLRERSGRALASTLLLQGSDAELSDFGLAPGDSKLDARPQAYHLLSVALLLRTWLAAMGTWRVLVSGVVAAAMAGFGPRLAATLNPGFDGALLSWLGNHIPPALGGGCCWRISSAASTSRRSWWRRRCSSMP